MKFDAKVVIPTQFVFFNFAAILGSAVLYRDFDSIPFERMVIFLYGCAATFLGVFVLSRATGSEEGEGDEGDEQDAASESGVSLRADGPHSGHVRRSSLTLYGSPPLVVFPTHGRPDSPSTATIRASEFSLPPPVTSTPSRGHPARSSNMSGTAVGTLRARASSTTIGLVSPAKYLLIGTTGSTPPAAVPVVSVPIRRQHSSSSTPSGSVPVTIAVGVPRAPRMTSRSPSRTRDGETDAEDETSASYVPNRSANGSRASGNRLHSLD